MFGSESARSAELGITGWGVISPIGIGHTAFAQGLRGGQSAPDEPVSRPDDEPMPCASARVIRDFEPKRFLGTKGVRVLDRTTALAVATTGMALSDSGLGSGLGTGERIGVVLGTSNGSMKSTFDYTRETLVLDKPYQVSAELFPNTVMNCAAGRCAIWHGLRGVNATISGGRLAGVLSLRYASRMVSLGYADSALVGAAEELSPEIAWGAYHAARRRREALGPLGEGCAMFVLEQRERAAASGRRVRAELLACEVGFDAGSPHPAPDLGLGACVRRSLERAGVGPGEVWAISSRASGLAALDGSEAEGLGAALAGERPVHRLSVGNVLGECFSASGALQLAGLLSLFESDPEASGRVGVLTSVSHGGRVGCAVLRAS